MNKHLFLYENTVLFLHYKFCLLSETTEVIRKARILPLFGFGAIFDRFMHFLIILWIRKLTSTVFKGIKYIRFIKITNPIIPIKAYPKIIWRFVKFEAFWSSLISLNANSSQLSNKKHDSLKIIDMLNIRFY